MEHLVEQLAGARIGDTFNQYAAGPRAPLLRARLAAYLDSRAGAPILLVGEAPGYRGGRVSGLPFTSERQLTGEGPAEATATIVHRVLGELGLERDVLLWNVVPTHPGTATSNRAPWAAEVRAGALFAEMLTRGRSVIAIGRIASRALGIPAVRHPSHGGAVRFAQELASVVGLDAPHDSTLRRGAGSAARGIAFDRRGLLEADPRCGDRRTSASSSCTAG
jgi:uracil-DNA glycosylase